MVIETLLSMADLHLPQQTHGPQELVIPQEPTGLLDGLIQYSGAMARFWTGWYWFCPYVHCWV